MLYIVHVYHFWVCVCQTKLLLKSRLSSHMELSLARFLTDHYHVIPFLVPSVQYNKTRNENKHYWPQNLLPENRAEIKTVIYWFCRSERTMNWPCCQDFSITQGSQFLWVNAGIYILHQLSHSENFMWVGLLFRGAVWEGFGIIYRTHCCVL